MTIQSPAKGRHPSAASATLGIITLDESGHVLAWNDAAEGIFGWKASEVIGKAPPYIPAEQIRDFHEMLRATLQSGPQTGLGLRRQHRSGARVEINVWMAPMPQNSHVMELIEDVTAANQKERELAQNSHFKSAILNALPEHVAVIDHTGLIIATNHSWNDFALENGLDDPARVGVGQNYLEVCRSVHGGEDYPYAHASLTGIQAVLNGHLHIFELEYPCHSPKEKRWFLMRVTPLEDGSGAVITHANITRRYNAETARLMAEKRLSTILNIAADCIVAIDGARNILVFNRWAERVFGYAAAEVIGKPIDILIPAYIGPRHAEIVNTHAKASQSTEKIIAEHIYMSGLRKDGTTFPAEASIAMVSLDSQPILVAVVRDITERARAENQIRTYATRQKMLAEFSVEINNLQTVQAITRMVNEKAREIIGTHLAITSGEHDPSIRAVSRSEKYAAHEDLEMIREESGLYTLVDQDNQLRLVTRDDLLETPILRRDGSRLGKIQLADKYGGAFDDNDEAVLVQLAQVAAVAIENALLYEEVRQAEQKYRSIFEHSVEGLFQITLQGELISGNPALARLLGYADIAEMIADQPEIRKYIFLNPEDYDRLLDALQRDGEVQGREVRFRTRDGSLRWVALSLNSRVTTADGTPVIEGSAVDISERKQRLRELEALAEISATLREAKNRAEMAPIILDQLLRSIGADSALFLYNDENGGALVEQARGDWAGLNGLRLDEGDARLEALRAARAPITLRPGADGMFENDLFRDYASLAAAPMLMQGDFAGAIWLGLRRKDEGIHTSEFNEADASLLGAIAEVASNAIMRSSLNQQIEQRLRTILALHSIDMAISSSLDARLTTRIILEQGATLLGVDAMDVLRYNRVTQYMEYTAGHGFNTRGIEQSRQRLGEGTAGQAALNRKMVVIPQLAEDNTFQRKKMVEAEKFVSYAAVPLIAKGQLKGLLEVFSRSGLHVNGEWRDLLETLATETAIALDNNQLFEDLQRSNIELTLAYDATIEGWSRALELKDRETEGHSQRVTKMTVQLARRLGAAEEDLMDIQRGAQLHDIGKMGIPDSILLKPGPLTDEEWTLMRSHVQLGVSMLVGIPFLKRALDIPRAHHEKWDGSGYPNRLKGKQIPLAARVFAVIDVWDALSYDRPYRGAWPQEKVVAYLKDQSGKHFDPEVLEAFLKMLGEGVFPA